MFAVNRGNQNRRRALSGFTLIELLLVMMIIAILAAVVVPKFAGKAEDARKKAAIADISNIKTQLSVFEIDNGRFPTSEEGIGALMTNPGNLPGWTHAYLDKMPVDPWGSPYVYHFPGSNGKDFDLYSKGPDMQDGTADDINPDKTN
jgi:general secretion pathway protein G